MPICQKIIPGNIDKEIYPLIKMLNDYGIKTIASCSGHDKKCSYIAIDLNSLEMVRLTKNNLAIDWILKK